MVSFFYRHSATMLNDQLVIFGGWDAPICYNDLHILDMSKCCWCIWSNLKGRKLIKTWILSISVGDGCILHMHTIYYVCCKGLQHSSNFARFFHILAFAWPCQQWKTFKNDHSCKNALKKPDMFSLLQIISLDSMSTKFFQRITLLMFLFLYPIVFSGFVEWSKPKVLGTPPLPRRLEFYHSDPLIFTMKK